MPRAQSISQAEWDRHQQEITELYMTPKMTLKKVMAHMEKHRSFCPRLVTRTGILNIRLQLIFSQPVPVRNDAETMESTKNPQ
jgi:hypothetical protein